jgi:hypothetical protein
MDQPVMNSPADLAFTMSIVFPMRPKARSKLCTYSVEFVVLPASTNFGGADRDRTDDLMLAKHALSQLSYGPMLETAGSICLDGLACRAGASAPGPAFAKWLWRGSLLRFASEGWWARNELNVRPHAYQACALTT